MDSPSEPVICAEWTTSRISSDPGLATIFDPPRPVTIRTAMFDPTVGVPPGLAETPPTLKVRAGGVRLESTSLGRQVAWLRTYDGQWRALVAIELTSANARTRIETHLWLPPEAIRPLPNH